MTNPLLAPFPGPFGLPPFDRIRDADFAPAFEVALAEARAAYAAIAADPRPADFANVVGAMERAEQTLAQVGGVFWNMVGADSNDARQAIESDMAPKLAAFSSSVLLDPALYARLKAVPEAGLGQEEARVLMLYRRAFRRAGAELDGPARARMAGITERLAVLTTEFGQKALAEEKDWMLPLSDDDLQGLPDALVAALRAAGTERGQEGPVMVLSRSLVVPFLQSSPRRDLRRRIHAAWIARGANGNANDTRALVTEILTLRQERARLMGHASFAAFKLETEMAGTPDRVRDLLTTVWPKALAKAAEDEAILLARARADGVNDALGAWDWRYYAEARRRQEHDLDEAVLKPYLPLDAMIGAAFDVAGRLFGLSFRPLDVPLYHPDVRAWEVTRDGAHVGIFIGDYFARPSKRGGAWMSDFRPQHKLDGGQSPIIVNVCNFAKGDPALLGWDDARTLFHEFGHALHGLLSDVTWPMVSGTSVARDFVELPSQLYEHWLEVPEVLKAHARHHQTGAPMPDDLRDRLLAARTFDAAHGTVEYTAAALVDLTLHGEAPPADVLARQEAILTDLGLPAAIRPMHSASHFRHLFAGDGYSAGYYSYMWSEVMDADAFEAFEEAGDPFDRATADRLYRLLSSGGSVAPERLYTDFRGRLPGVEALLRGRGLIPAT